MPSKKSAAKSAASVDPKSADILLAYTGDGSALTDTPARHLSHADVARMAFRRSLAATAAEGIRPDPLDPDPKVVADVIDGLLESGHFSDDADLVGAATEPAEEPAAEAPAAEPDQPTTDQPTPPADQPAPEPEV